MISPLQASPGQRHLLLAVAVVAALCGCASVPPPILPEREPSAMELALGGSLNRTPAADAPASAASAAQAPSATTRLFQTPPAPRTALTQVTNSPAGSPVPEDNTLEVAVDIEQQPMPAFIDTVFAKILKRNVSVDPAVAARKEMISLKSGKPQTARGLYDAARSVLKSFNVAVIEYNGLVRITPATGPTGFIPEVRRGRSLPEVPAALRPVFQIVDLETVSPASVVGWLRTVFGQRLQLQDDVANSAVIISGQSDDVAAGIEAIRVLDQPTMRGRSSARIAPLFWSADELAKRLAEILGAQGYQVSAIPQGNAPIILLPVPPLNSVIVFARSDEVLNHVLRWATEIDQPASGRGSAGYFTYPVRNLDASDLAKTLQDVMNPTVGASNAAGTVRSRVVVNPGSNTLIIQGNPTEYQQWFGLLQELDRPARSALVSVTIAEVRLNTGEQLGFEWMLKEFQSGGYTVNAGTIGAFGTSAIGGLAAVITSNGSTSPRALLNALASTSRVRVLANPSVMARNGESAFIQIGSEVPVVSSQQSLGTTSTGSVPGGGSGLQTGVLQTIQYRNTGVILKVKPVIHAGGRVDLDVEQEVSSANATLSGVTASPTISTRKINTKLTVIDGATVLLGGLMQETTTSANTGVPLLKDVPGLGNLFKSRNDTRDRTELVVLITPYVIADEFEAQAITDAFRRQFKWDASVPTQGLRPERSSSTPPISAPRNDEQRDGRGTPRPYVLPAADEKLPAPAAGGVRTGTESGELRSRPDFGNTSTTREAAAAPQVKRPEPKAGQQAPGETKTVTDQQILKELQNAIKQK